VGNQAVPQSQRFEVLARPMAVRPDPATTRREKAGSLIRRGVEKAFKLYRTRSVAERLQLRRSWAPRGMEVDGRQGGRWQMAGWQAGGGAVSGSLLLKMPDQARAQVVAKVKGWVELRLGRCGRGACQTQVARHLSSPARRPVCPLTRCSASACVPEPQRGPREAPASHGRPVTPPSWPQKLADDLA
jgi:hypothetical protein